MNTMSCEVCKKGYIEFDPYTIDEMGEPKYYTNKEQNIRIYFCSVICSYNYYKEYQKNENRRRN